MKTITAIKRTIIDNSLIEEGSRVLVALSGGADSVLLTIVLSELSKEMKFSLFACHVEHGIRGVSSVSDMEFSKSLCEKLGIPIFIKRINVPKIAEEKKISEETAGRIARYEFFEELLLEHKLDVVATAHHRDDKVETILMNMLRGSGLRGFIGIKYKNNNIIRPLLDISKAEILECCRENEIPYCTDETNFENDYTRNKIRNVLLPSLREFNPSFDECLLRESMIISEDDLVLDELASKTYAEVGNDIQKIMELETSIKRRVIFKLIAEAKGTERDISFDDVASVLALCENGKTGKSVNISGGFEAGISYGKLNISNEKIENKDYEYELKIESVCEINELNMKFKLEKTNGRGFSFPEGACLKIRNKRAGDCFYPVGMIGKKKLKDYFIDKKIDRTKREIQPILTVDGEIASVIGLRNDRRYYGNNGEYTLVAEKL